MSNEEQVDANLVIAKLRDQISTLSFELAIAQARLATTADNLTKAMQALHEAHNRGGQEGTDS